MLSLGDLIDYPLSVVEKDFETTQTINVAKTLDYFKSRFAEKDDVAMLPSLNDISPQYISPNSLVRFRCIIQDMYDPEYGMGVFETENRNTKEKKLRLGLFKDFNICEDEEEILIDSTKKVTVERQNLYCVPIPGETTWVKESYLQCSKFKIQEGSNQSPCLKRQRSGENEMETETMETEPGQMRLNVAGTKRHRTITNSSVHSTSPTDDLAKIFDLNFPLPGEKGAPCIVTIYESQERFKLNDMYEMIGILSSDPTLSKKTMGAQSNEEADTTVWPEMMSPEENLARYPPTSLVPRLHCVVAKKINYHCPLMATSIQSNEEVISQAPKDLASTRADLVQLLTRLLYGDELAAEFLVLNIISRVYARADVIPLGKFGLNISNCRESLGINLRLTKELSEFLSYVVSKNHYQQLTVKDLNEIKVIPTKDYRSNRLVSGMLQLAPGTHLILDETVMQPGQLGTQGVKNVTAIGNLIQWQKVDYDFSFQKCEILADVPVIVVSEGRSLFKCDCILPLMAKDSSSPTAASLMSAIPKSTLDKIRIYIEYVRNLNYDLGPEMQKELQDYYINLRTTGANSMNQDLFQVLLVTARLYALSYGQNTLTTALWRKVTVLDNERQQRLTQIGTN